MFKKTTAVKRLLKVKARKKVVQGGTSSGKTYAIIAILISRLAKTERQKCTVVAETLPSVKEGAMDIFKNIMHETGRWRESGWNASSLTYTFANKSRIQFKSFDSVGKAKASGKRDILFLNEANHIPFLIADALMIRSRITWIDFNPDNEFWAHTETLKEPNSEFILINYEDNEALPPEILEDILIKRDKAFHDVNLPYPAIYQADNIKSGYWANWCKVYIYGQIGSLEGTVFSNWETIHELPKEAKLTYYGLDFGYTNDPTALIARYEWNGKVIYDEVIYKTGLQNDDIIRLMEQSGISKGIKGYADSAEPKSIDYIRRKGWNLKPVIKGKDSILFGIQQVQRHDQFLVTSRSLNLIEELRKYKWDTDREGNTMNVPIDAYNHAIDALRYVEMMCSMMNTKPQGASAGPLARHKSKRL